MKRALILMLALATSASAALLTGCSDDESKPNTTDTGTDASSTFETGPTTDATNDGSSTETGTTDTGVVPDSSASETTAETGAGDTGGTETSTDAPATETGSSDGGEAGVGATVTWGFAADAGAGFAPITIQAGQSVTWNWNGNHDVVEAESGTGAGRCTAKTGGFSSGASASPYVRQFTQPGTYYYFCSKGNGAHCQTGGMFGTIIVQ